jgi:hypothetical protein
MQLLSGGWVCPLLQAAPRRWQLCGLVPTAVGMVTSRRGAPWSLKVSQLNHRRDYSARGELQRLAEEGEPQGLEHLDALFAGGVQIRADRAERLRCCFRPETAADFLLHLGATDRPLCLVVCKGNAGLVHEQQHLALPLF